MGWHCPGHSRSPVLSACPVVCGAGPGNPTEARRQPLCSGSGRLWPCRARLGAVDRAELPSVRLLPWVSEPPAPGEEGPFPSGLQIGPCLLDRPPPAWPRLPRASRKQESRLFPGFPPFPGGPGHHLGSGFLGAQQPPHWTPSSQEASGFARDSLWVGTFSVPLVSVKLRSLSGGPQVPVCHMNSASLKERGPQKWLGSWKEQVSSGTPCCGLQG